jgi:hemoglobin-like flavoprotein
MTAAQIILIKKSWGIFRGIDPALVGDVFYSRLFYKSPRLKSMFKSSMADQNVKLIDMLTYLVTRLDRLDEITEEVAQLAVRHTGYGVKRSHYKLVGEALLWTLETGLGNDWNNEIKEAWKACYETISDIMMNAVNK